MKNAQPRLSRRHVFAGVGAAGALAAVAAVTPSVRPESPPEQPKPDDGQRRGYQVTEHVLQYYRTTRV